MDFQVINRAAEHFRARRMQLFAQTFELTEETRVLDVGGSPEIWDLMTIRPRLTILNFPTALEWKSSVNRVGGDGCALPFRDKSFDLVFSNSVIEHVGSRAKQEQFAREIVRVGLRYWIQTPNRRFPFDQHLLMPFLHLLPKKWQRPIAERGTGWELVTQPSAAQRDYYLDHCLNEVILLSAGDLKKLFPGARLVYERLIGWPKSLIAIGS